MTMPGAEWCFPFINNFGLKTLRIFVGAASCGGSLRADKVSLMDL